ncbi:MAG: tRNA 2-thiouridine(34) synthase MnmA [Eubacteriales bacterium]|nr:tRNA 2-thiouridine(34) synthase MnmA [Eubacteriales bacterium]MDY3332956.1 tRNA 2-thiouridine(34) synthase MnmA [Gallibacter sp.]
MINLDKKRVILGLSGGVDSTVAAIFLLEQGYEVIGLHFTTIHSNQDNGIDRAREVAKKLNIKLIEKDVSKEFSNIVISDFIYNYSLGMTPNPCALCNPTVKFKTLIDVANAEGVYHIATGHYARVKYSEKYGCYLITKSINKRKDQSYVLYGLEEDVIKRIIFPLEKIEDKTKIRQVAKDNDMLNANAPDSQEICFIADDENYIDFIKKYNKKYSDKTGNFVDNTGKILGTHKGIAHYTIGQRKGLGIALGKPAFVTKIDAKNNEVCLGDNDELFKNNVIINNVKLVPKNIFSNKNIANLSGKVRYNSDTSRCNITQQDDLLLVTFDQAQRAITPGQILALYDEDFLLGGGVIV